MKILLKTLWEKVKKLLTLYQTTKFVDWSKFRVLADGKNKEM